MPTFARVMAIIVSAAALSTGIAFTVSADDSGAIKYRQAVMRAVGGHMGSSVAIIKGQVPYRDDLVAHAAGLDDMARILPNAFEQKTSGGKTRAKPNIWEDSADFQQKIRELQAAAAEFLAAAKSGGPEAASAKLGALGESCKGCHKKYRAKKS